MASVDFNTRCWRVLEWQWGDGAGWNKLQAVWRWRNIIQSAMGFTCAALAYIFSNPERLTGRLKPLGRGNGKLSQCSCGFKADCLI